MSRLFLVLALLSAFCLNLSADIKARYYNDRNEVENDERTWTGKISKLLDGNTPCYNKRADTCRWTHGRQQCYTFTYSADVNDRSLYADSFIYFAYDHNIKRKCFDDKDKRFKHPLPVLEENKDKYVNINLGWSAVWDGYVNVPSDGDWVFGTSVAGGKAYLEIWDKDGKTSKKVVNNLARGFINEGNTDKLLTFNGMKKGWYRFKIRFSSAPMGQDIWFQWYNKSGGYTPKLEKAFGRYQSHYSIGNMGVIPAEYFAMEKPLPEPEFRVVEKEFATHGSQKGFEWVWKSPLRTKIAGANNWYCIIAGYNDEGTYKQYPKDLEVSVAFNYAISKEGGDKKIITEKNTDNSLKYYRYPLTDGKTGNKVMYFTLKGSSYGTCFEYGAEKTLTRSGYFSVFTKAEESKVYTEPRVSSNNTFAISPAGYDIKFKEVEIKNNSFTESKDEIKSDKDLISELDKSLVTLYAGKTYKAHITAQALESKDKMRDIKSPKDATITINGKSITLGKYYSFVNDPLMIAQIGKDQECVEDRNVSLGKQIYDKNANTKKEPKFGLPFRENVAEIKLADYKQAPKSGDIHATNVFVPYTYDKKDTSKMIPYTNVMKFEAKMVDKEWAKINFVGLTTDKEGGFNTLTKEKQNELKDRIKTYGYECKFEKDSLELHPAIKNIKAETKYDKSLAPCEIFIVKPKFIEIIPNKFSFILENVKNAGNGFTYINGIDKDEKTKTSDAHTMLANITVHSAALGANDKRLTNFSDKCYATDVNMTISYVGDKYLKDKTSLATKVDLKSKVDEYEKEKNKYAHGDDVNASERIIFDGTYHKTFSQSIEFNKDAKDFNQNKYNEKSMTYSDYDKTAMTNKAPYKIDKKLFLKDNNGSAIFRIGFNFKRNQTKPENPFVVSTLDFDVSEPNPGYLSPRIKSVTYDTNQSNYSDTQEKALMLFGKVYAPYYEGPKSGFNADIYYGFYCSGCYLGEEVSGKAQGFLEYKGSAMPSALNFFINKAHTNTTLGYYADYTKVNNTDMKPVDSTTPIKEGNQTTHFQNANAVIDDIGLLLTQHPWLLHNKDENKNTNDFRVRFLDSGASNWGGKAIDSTGEEVTDGAGKFIMENEDMSKKPNRRIDW